MKWETIPTLIITHLALIITILLMALGTHELYHNYQFERDYNMTTSGTCFMGINELADTNIPVGWTIPHQDGIDLEPDRMNMEIEASIFTIILTGLMLVIYAGLFWWLPIHRATQRLEDEIEWEQLNGYWKR